MKTLCKCSGTPKPQGTEWRAPRARHKIARHKMGGPKITQHILMSLTRENRDALDPCLKTPDSSSRKLNTSPVPRHASVETACVINLNISPPTDQGYPLPIQEKLMRYPYISNLKRYFGFGRRTLPPCVHPHPLHA